VLISRAAQSKRIAFGGMQIERSTYSRMEDFTVDVAGIEPATPCLRSTGVDSNPSIDYF